MIYLWPFFFLVVSTVHSNPYIYSSFAVVNARVCHARHGSLVHPKPNASNFASTCHYLRPPERHSGERFLFSWHADTRWRRAASLVQANRPNPHRQKPLKVCLRPTLGRRLDRSPFNRSQDVESSCPAGTVLTGLNYLKGEQPVLAKPDEEYPAWLWDLTKPKVLADDGPGGKAEKRRLRLVHRQTLKDSNMFKAK